MGAHYHMTTYYIDSIKGSNANSGVSEGSALQSLDAIATLKLKAGDSVLLARGSTFTSTLKIMSSGDAGNPITIGAYGDGDAPLLTGPMGVYGSKASNIVVKDIAIANTTQTAIYAGSAANWVIDNVSLSNTGTATGIGSIVFKNGSNITVSNSKFDYVSSDAIYMVEVDGVTLTNNSITNVRGRTADGIQVNDSKNVTVSGNVIDVATSADSTKGGILVHNSAGVAVDHNVVTGGGFGVSVNGWNVAITDNTISGQDKYAWSAAVLISGAMNLSDYVIKGNAISHSNFGVALTGLAADNVTRTNIAITDNSFTDMLKYALKIDKLSTGTFEGNEVVNSQLSFIRSDAQQAAFAVGANQTLSTEEAAQLHAPKPVEVVTPHVEAPVVTPEPAAPVDTHVPTPEPVVSTPVHVPAPEPAAPVPTPAAPVVVSPPAAPVTAPVVSAPAPVAAAPASVGAKMDVYSMSAGLQLSGNIMANDFRSDGELMSLRSVNSARVGAEGVDVKGVYGMLHVAASGDFTYTLDHAGLTLLTQSGTQIEKFQYKAADGKVIDTSKLMIDLTDFVVSPDHLLLI